MPGACDRPPQLPLWKLSTAPFGPVAASPYQLWNLAVGAHVVRPWPGCRPRFQAAASRIVTVEERVQPRPSDGDRDILAVVATVE